MRRAFIDLHIAVFLAGLTGILGRLITLPEGPLVWWRMGIASVVLWIIALFREEKLLPKGKALWSMIGVGVLIALHWTFFYGSIKYGNVSIGLVCFSAVSFFTALFDPLISRRRFDAVELLLGLMVMAGIWLIFTFDARYATGIWMGMISSMLCAMFVILNKSVLMRNPQPVVTRTELTAGFLALTFILPPYMMHDGFGVLLPSLSSLAWLFVLAVLCTVVAITFSNRALGRISPFTVNLTYNLEPVYGIILAFVVYREDKELGPSFYIGLSIILATVFIQSWRMWRKGRPARR
jgi:drug/metabolite transporter (DMT)-like permease